MLTLKPLWHISCPMTLWPRNVLPVPSNLNFLCLVWKGLLPLLPLILSQALVRWVSTCNGTQKRSTTSSIKPEEKSFTNGELPTQMWPSCLTKLKLKEKGNTPRRKSHPLSPSVSSLNFMKRQRRRRKRTKMWPTLCLLCRML